MKIKWRVQDKTGSVWHPRGWPRAFIGDYIVAAVYSDSGEAYVPRLVREGAHGPLILRIARYSEDGTTFRWMRSTQLFETLEKAKSHAHSIIEEHPEFLPPALRAH